MLPEMVDAGVNNLNLHHLRLTYHNAKKLIPRGYHIVSSERPLVVESEIAALEIINAAQKAGIEIGINYCSFYFKNRFQKAGYRRIITQKIFPDAAITENAYIREYCGDSITYKSVKIFNRKPLSQNEVSFLLNGAEYAYEVINCFIEKNLSLFDQRNINDLITQEPDNPPKDLLLFKIWQYEYIENGLREY